MKSVSANMANQESRTKKGGELGALAKNVEGYNYISAIDVGIPGRALQFWSNVSVRVTTHRPLP